MSSTPERTGWSDPLVEYVVPDGQHIAVGVVLAADAAGLAPADRPRTLAAHVDPDALEDLVGHGNDGSTAVEFTLWDHRVHVSDSTVRIGPYSDRPSP